jgi:hypothetical protein
VADRLGAGYQELRQVNPRLVYCPVTGYDPAGPDAQAAGHDINYLAVSGLLGVVGPAGGAPVPRSTWSPISPEAACWPRSASAWRSSSRAAPGAASGSTPR